MPHCGLSTNDDGLFIDDRNCVVIPIESEKLRLRMCVIAHAGLNSGRIGYHAANKFATAMGILERNGGRSKELV